MPGNAGKSTFRWYESWRPKRESKPTPGMKTLLVAPKSATSPIGTVKPLVGRLDEPEQLDGEAPKETSGRFELTFVTLKRIVT